jgi:ATP-dependent RNA helicase DDX23/PRP28
MSDDRETNFPVMSAEEEAEARQHQEIAERAEKRAAERALLNQSSSSSSASSSRNEFGEKINDDGTRKRGLNGNNKDGLDEKEGSKKATFLSKQQREEQALQRLETKRSELENKSRDAEDAHARFITGKSQEEKRREDKAIREKETRERERRQKDENKDTKELDNEVKAIREHYLGGGEKKKKITKTSDKFAKIFQFDWEAEDDTARNDANPLYQKRVKISALFGRGYIAGMDQREQRKQSNFINSLTEKRMAEAMRTESEDGKLTESEKRERARQRDRASEALKRRQNEELLDMDAETKAKMGSHWSEKALDLMTERDWRIFREDFDIRVQGGRATLPLRFWKEGNFPDEVMQAIEAMGYEKPSPIQRQAIPIGQAKRDIIGIAETGSGKTAAFVIPLLCYMLQLPPENIARIADEGPLAIVMAPTRELAQQIDEECQKLAKFTKFETVCVVGGQSIEEQGFRLRKGVHIVIGTPGRLIDCIENNYLVLNQCNYVVLDEADRMIDMGFEPQVVGVLEAMGGLLKSEDEEQAEQQLRGATTTDLYRVTAMFSATMPTEVERIARKYLRHPAVLKIGDESSGKNKRIEQRVVFMPEGQKKNKLTEELRRMSSSDKVIVFVNAKKTGDTIGRFLETASFRCGVLHGGRSQDQREETLESFRSGDIQILVATDVAGRGLDIPDVSFVFNYDLPTKIENYCHRIGRTGRAGKSGIAISFLCDGDSEIMHALKTYLESTNAPVPQQLAKHPSAQAVSGARDDRGNIIGAKRDSIKFAKK